MKYFYFILVILNIVVLSCTREKTKPLISYVNLMLGTMESSTVAAKMHNGDHLDFPQTIPAVTAPFGMTQWTPQNQSSQQKCIAPYYLSRNVIQGFRATHWTSGSCVQDYGSFTVMPITGNRNTSPNIRQSEFVYDPELLSPAYSIYHIGLYNIMAEVTATKRCGFLKFSWLDPEDPAIIFDVNNDEGRGFIQIDPVRKEIIAANPVKRIYSGSGKPAGFSGYMVAKIDCDFKSFGTYSQQASYKDSVRMSDMPAMGAWVQLKSPKNDVACVKVGTSFTSIENARENLENEIPGWNFSATRHQLEKIWEDLLGRTKVDGADKDEMIKFYTAIYHSCQQPRLYSDVNGSYPGFGGDTTIHHARDFDYYCDFSAWDTYRAQMPLLSLIAPREYENMIKSLIAMAEQGGWLPIFPMWNSYTSAMIGDHCSAIIGDALMKGFRFDKEKAWTYMRKNAFEIPSDYKDYKDGKGRRALRTYIEYGYIPLEDEVLDAFHKREQVSRTLEYAYDDWVLSQVARELGHESDYRELRERSRNYTNVFNSEKGWVCGRFTDGTFTADFDPGKSVSWITEGTPKQYTWSVQHDINGLAELMGGRDSFFLKLKSFIDNREYWHGNEPSHHIPYLFNYTGRWDLTQRTVKEILKTNYNSNAGGISGNDDSGQMSAWYVFSAMGFYPVCPGSNEYQLSSPVFRKVTLKLDKKYYPGGKFILETNGNPADGIFSKVYLNGKETGTVLMHDAIKKGGTLLFR